MTDLPPFTLRLPDRPRTALVVTSPHSGRSYPPAFLAQTRLDSLAVRRSEDAFVDELFAAAPALGVPLLAATFPRAWCDANREAWELDPAMFSDPLPPYVNTASPRVAAGLGTVARVVGAGEPIYAGKLRFAEAQARIEGAWEPFHAALERLIADTRARFGHCLVLDCHSMPTPPGRHAPRVDAVLGDGHGASCGPAWSGFMAQYLAGMGYTVRRNQPYAGGYITRHYGNPRQGVQVVQLELARGLYLNERGLTRGPRFEAVRGQMSLLLAALVDAERSFGAPGPAVLAAE